MDFGDHEGMRCSSDLCQRVLDCVRSGSSKAEAARRFKVGEASVYRWVKPGGVAYKRPGPQRPHKLDWEAVRRYVEVHPDRTQAERARHFQVSRHGIWYAPQRLQVTHKKGWATKNAIRGTAEGSSAYASDSCAAANSRSISMNVGSHHRQHGGMDMH